jgi:hypothetical protein
MSHPNADPVMAGGVSIAEESAAETAPTDVRCATFTHAPTVTFDHASSSLRRLRKYGQRSGMLAPIFDDAAEGRWRSSWFRFRSSVVVGEPSWWITPGGNVLS